MLKHCIQVSAAAPHTYFLIKANGSDLRTFSENSCSEVLCRQVEPPEKQRYMIENSTENGRAREKQDFLDWIPSIVDASCKTGAP